MSGLESLYLVVAGVSLLILLIALLFGGADVDHGIDVSHDVDHGDIADGPSWFGMRVILGALFGFGAIGFATFNMGLGYLSLLLAIPGFFVMAVIVRQFVLVPLLRQQSNSLLSRSSYEGKFATVTLEIRPDSTGIVEFIDDNGTRVREHASSHDDAVVPVSTSVLIVEVHPDRVVVDAFHPHL